MGYTDIGAIQKWIYLYRYLYLQEAYTTRFRDWNIIICVEHKNLLSFTNRLN